MRGLQEPRLICHFSIIDERIVGVIVERESECTGIDVEQAAHDRIRFNVQVGSPASTLEV